MRTFTLFSGHTVSCKTAAQSYADGFETGVNWTDPWKPGGPFVATYPETWDEQLKAYGDANVENYKEWHRGFKDGQNERTRTVEKLSSPLA